MSAAYSSRPIPGGLGEVEAVFLADPREYIEPSPPTSSAEALEASRCRGDKASLGDETGVGWALLPRHRDNQSAAWLRSGDLLWQIESDETQDRLGLLGPRHPRRIQAI
jgi:hypothetical protein